MNSDQLDLTLPKFVIVEGPIGVGKTDLAQRIAETYSYSTVFEQVDHNPFLSKFYQSPQHNALAAQLHFLFQRIQQLETLQQADMFEPMHISDYMMEKNALFAEAVLTADEYSLYKMVYDKLVVNATKPDLVIYLQASTPALIQRIQQRGIEHEQYLTNDYVDRINQAYSRFFHYYDNAPLLIVNAEHSDVLFQEHNFKQLLNYMQTIRSGRHYFNPSLANEVLI